MFKNLFHIEQYIRVILICNFSLLISLHSPIITYLLAIFYLSTMYLYTSLLCYLFSFANVNQCPQKFLRFIHVLLSMGYYNNIPQTGCLKQQTFLTVLEAGKSKIRVPVRPSSGEGLLPGPSDGGESTSGFSSSSYENTNPISRTLFFKT